MMGQRKTEGWRDAKPKRLSMAKRKMRLPFQSNNQAKSIGKPSFEIFVVSRGISIVFIGLEET